MWKETALEAEPEVLTCDVTRGEATIIADGSWYRELNPTKGGAC